MSARAATVRSRREKKNPRERKPTACAARTHRSDVIRQWISDGAGNAALNRVASAHFAVIASSPADHARAAGPLALIVVSFNHELDATLLNDTTVQLEERAGERPRDPATPRTRRW